MPEEVRGWEVENKDTVEERERKQVYNHSVFIVDLLLEGGYSLLRWSGQWPGYWRHSIPLKMK